MKLVEVAVHNFRSICESMDECILVVEPDLTCLIGASESGKSNILHAMENSKMVNLVFKDVVTRVGAFATESDSMLGKAAKAWLETGGRSGKDIHEVGGAFRSMLEKNRIEPSEFVRTRFAALIGAISEATSDESN